MEEVWISFILKVVAALLATVGGGLVTLLIQQLAQLRRSVSALQGKVSDLRERVTACETKLEGLEQ